MIALVLLLALGQSPDGLDADRKELAALKAQLIELQKAKGAQDKAAADAAEAKRKADEARAATSIVAPVAAGPGEAAPREGAAPPAGGVPDWLWPTGFGAVAAAGGGAYVYLRRRKTVTVRPDGTIITTETTTMAFKQITLANGQQITLVPREQLRFKGAVKTMTLPFHLKAAMAAIPVAPPTYDGSKGRTIKYPILGNDRVGNCYLADALHCIQTFTGNNGPEAQFDLNAVLSLYRQMSGGDNGLSDGDVFPPWKSQGFFGHKILDYMTIDPSNDVAVRFGLWAFCGGSWTCSLLTGWLDATSPGTVWDANMGRPDPSAGHAMHLSGYDQQYYQDETWAIDPCIRLTPAGMKAADPEVTVQFSLEMFNAAGYAPNGLHYTVLAPLWQQLGGSALPPSPFPAPGPGPTPVPPTPPVPPVPGTFTPPFVLWVSGFQIPLLSFPDAASAVAMAQQIYAAGNLPVTVKDSLGQTVQVVPPSPVPVPPVPPVPVPGGTTIVVPAAGTYELIDPANVQAVADSGKTPNQLIHAATSFLFGLTHR